MARRVDELLKEVNSYRPLEDSLQTAIYEKFMADWTHNSTAIEGNQLTLPETIFFIRNGLTVQGKPFNDYVEVKNHAEAIDFLYDMVNESREITESLIKETHALLLKGIDCVELRTGSHILRKLITPGAYKLTNNHVLTGSGEIHYYADSLQVPGEMESLIKWYNESKTEAHAVDLSAKFHHKLTYIHPFDDGNGRVARLFMNLILIKNQFPPAVIKAADRFEYYAALENADRGDIAPFAGLVEKQVEASLNVMLNEIRKYRQHYKYREMH